MINNILMSLYSILPNEEKNEFYYFKQADNYLSALLPYKLTDITNVDNFLITTGTINIKYDILNLPANAVEIKNIINIRRLYMDKEQALEEFNRNKYFIETLTTKYLSYPNYEDVKVVR